tara:strand:- start:58787 stop:58966 length:180 start_codon:yes stop_codon:yes gene_type:complete
MEKYEISEDAKISIVNGGWRSSIQFDQIDRSEWMVEYDIFHYESIADDREKIIDSILNG